MAVPRESVKNHDDPLGAAVFRDLQQSAKYRRLCGAALRRFAFEASKRFSIEKDAFSWAKRKLHQSFGAFMSEGSYRRIGSLVGRFSRCRSQLERKELCRQILACHASTRERTPILEELYPRIFRIIGKPATILDLACGLNPFSAPWMDLGSGAEYLAVDGDCRLADSIAAFFSAVQFPGKVICDDLFSFAQADKADLVFLLKTLPCLERQRPGSGVEVIRKLRCRHLVVSFPTATLGGRRKGFPQGYRRYAEGIAAELRLPATRFEYPSELFYLFDMG